MEVTQEPRQETADLKGWIIAALYGLVIVLLGLAAWKEYEKDRLGEQLRAADARNIDLQIRLIGRERDLLDRRGEIDGLRTRLRKLEPQSARRP